MQSIGFKIINLNCVIGRRGIIIQLPLSILAKLIILKPIAISIPLGVVINYGISVAWYQIAALNVANRWKITSGN
jgi:hypothetical protein